MNAVCVYVSAAQLVLQSDDNVDANAMQRRLLDIGRLLPHLRQLLSCVVCCRLLTDPFTPRTGRCQHNVCRQCVRERKSLRPLCPTCKDCQDFKMYEENRQMRCLLLCYKSLCEHLMSSTLFSQISKQRPPHPVTVNSTQPSIPLPHLSTQEFVLEGASYESIPSSFSGDLPRGLLPRSIVPMATVTPTAPNSIAHLLPNTQIAPKAATPPTSNSGNSSSSSGISTSLIIPTVPKRDNIINTSTVATTTTISSTPIQIAHCSNNNSSNINISSNSTSIAVQTQAHSTPTTTTTVATALPTVLPSHQQQQQQQLQQQQQPQQQLHQQQQTLTMKHLRSIADLSAAALHAPTTATAKTLVPGSGTTITYVSGNTPGIVVPIVSSSGTTTAPLTIASSKFRQLTQVRQQALNNSAAVAAAAAASVTNANNITVATAKPLSDLHQQHQPQQQLTRAPFKFSVTPAGVAVSTATSTPLQTVTGNTTAPTITTTTSTTATVTSQIRHPPPIKTVSNGSAMYSVLYTGIGNKITIKRKTDGDDDATQKKNAATAAAANAAATSTGGTSASGTSPTNVFRQLPKPNPKRRGCRCGNATATPGKLTCCGQRCPCYVESKSCIGCKCRGCRNPHRPDGGKVRPVIPELACYEIQMADESSSLSPNELPIATNCTLPSDIMQLPTTTTQQHTATTTTLEEYHNTTTAATVLPQHQFNNSTASAATTTTATLIPLRSLHQLTAAAQQQHHHHQQQQQQQHLHHQQQTQMFTSVASNSNSNSGGATTSTSNVLLQNAEGKYQVVPLHHFTTAHGHANQTVVGQIAGLQRSQTMTTVNSTFILPNAATVAAVTSTAASSSTCPTSSAANVISTQLPQIITMHQHQQTHLQQRITSSNATAGTNVNTALPLQQLQQQLKQNNIITVHPLPPNTNSSSNNSTNNNTMNNSNSIHTQLQQLQQQQQQQHHHHHHQSIPLIGNSVSVAPNTTITLSPIIVNSTHAGNTFTADMFHTADGTSVGEYISVKSVRTATPNSNASSNSSSLSPQIITVPLAQASPLNTNTANLTCANVVSSSNNPGVTNNNSANVMSNISVSVNNVTMHN